VSGTGAGTGAGPFDTLQPEVLLRVLRPAVDARERCLAGERVEQVPYDGIPTLGGAHRVFNHFHQIEARHQSEGTTSRPAPMPAPCQHCADPSCPTDFCQSNAARAAYAMEGGQTCRRCMPSLSRQTAVEACTAAPTSCALPNMWNVPDRRNCTWPCPETRKIITAHATRADEQRTMGG